MDVGVGKDSRAVTLEIDARDYDTIAAELSESLLSDSVLALGGAKVLSLGPVDTDYCKYAFDVRRFQEKLQTILLRSRRIGVNFAVDAVKDNSAATARYNVMLLQWRKESTVDPQDLRTFGSLAGIDYLLFGRLSEQTAQTGGHIEVTYTFNWKLGSCESGLLAWADERVLTKFK